MIQMRENVRKYAELFLPVRSMGRGTDRRLVEGPLRLAAFGPSIAPLARHLPEAALQGGYA